MSEPVMAWAPQGWSDLYSGVYCRGADDRIYQNSHVDLEDPSSGWVGWTVPFPPGPHSPRGRGTPAVVGAHGHVPIEVFHPDVDGSLWWIAQTSPALDWNPLANWPASGWTSLGGVLVGDPVVVYQAGTGPAGANGIRHVFHRGTDNRCYYRWRTSLDPTAPWSNWQSLGGILVGDPVVARNWDGRLEVFHRGTDNALYHRWQTKPGDPAAWSPAWESLGGILIGQPAVVVSTGGMSAFHRGTTGGLYHAFFYQGKWSGWQMIAAGLTGDPSVALYAGNALSVCFRAENSGLRWGYQSGQVPPPPNAPWTWQTIGGTAAGDPVLSQDALGGDNLAVYYRGVQSDLQVGRQ